MDVLNALVEKCPLETVLKYVTIIAETRAMDFSNFVALIRGRMKMEEMIVGV